MPFPRPPREFTRPSAFYPTATTEAWTQGKRCATTGSTRLGLRHSGGRLRESGIQGAESIIAAGSLGTAAAVRGYSEAQAGNLLQRGGDWLDRTLRIPRRPAGTGTTAGRSACTANHRAALGSGTTCWQRAGQRAAEVERAAARDIESFASQQLAEAEASEGFATAAETAAGAAEAAAAVEGGGVLAALGEGALATAGAVGAATGGSAVAGAGAALVGTAWAIEGGLNAASHLMGWGAATGGGTDSDASRPSTTTDVQTLNGTQESGAVDHYFIQEQRQRSQRRQPEVFRIDTESESEPRNRPLPQIRSRPARRPRPQAQTPFGLNNVPIPVSSGSERSRVSRQSAATGGPWGASRPLKPFVRRASQKLHKYVKRWSR